MGNTLHSPPTELTPEQLKEIMDFWAQFAAVGFNINRLDPNDPSWMKPEHDEPTDDYRTNYGRDV